MTDDKLADALDNATMKITSRQTGREFDIPVLSSDDPFCFADGKSVADWLRSPDGIAALTRDDKLYQAMENLIMNNERWMYL